MSLDPEDTDTEAPAMKKVAFSTLALVLLFGGAVHAQSAAPKILGTYVGTAKVVCKGGFFNAKVTLKVTKQKGHVLKGTATLEGFPPGDGGSNSTPFNGVIMGDTLEMIIGTDTHGRATISGNTAEGYIHSIGDLGRITTYKPHSVWFVVEKQ